MSLLSSFFSRDRRDPLAPLRKLLQRQAWADLLLSATHLDPSTLSQDESQELESLKVRAGDELAHLNIFEGEAQLRNGDQATAREHFLLARSQAKTEGLRAAIEEKLADKHFLPSPNMPDCSAGGCCAASSSEVIHTESTFSVEERLELISAADPAEISSLYYQMQGTMADAVLHAHTDDFVEAMALFEQVADLERGAVFYFERGALQARHGDLSAGIDDMRCCLEHQANFSPAAENLVDLLLTQKDFDEAAKQLHANRLPDIFIKSRQAVICYEGGDFSQSLTLALAALQLDITNTDMHLLAGRLYERNADLDRAALHFAALSGGGCGGATGNLQLAEFNLRHGRDLPTALESFKHAARHEPDNPYWWLRIGQAYLRLGWTREGRELLNKVAASGTSDMQIVVSAREELSNL